MIAEAYFWNLDQFIKPVGLDLDDPEEEEDYEYKFIPWWFKFNISLIWRGPPFTVEDSPTELDFGVDQNRNNIVDTGFKTHKYEQGDEQSGINKYPWIKQPVDLLGIMDHPHPYAYTAEATTTERGEFILGCQD